MIKLSRGRSVCLSSALWKNGKWDPDAVWHHRSDGSRDKAGSGVWGSVYEKGYFWGRIWGALVTIVTNGDFTAYVCDSAATRPSSEITLGRLVTLSWYVVDRMHWQKSTLEQLTHHQLVEIFYINAKSRCSLR